MKQLDITIYTGQGAVTYTVKVTSENFTAALLAAIEKGFVTVETIDGAILVINALCAAAIEIGNEEDIPPV